MSTRPPTRSIQESDPAGLEDLEELGDDAIIAQQSVAHAPRPRANISEESRSVVITDHQRGQDTEPPRASARPPRSSAEATLVIRDRRALDELRTQIELGRLKKDSRRRPVYLWAALGLGAFLLGGIVAFLATDGRAEDQLPPAPGSEAAPLARPLTAASPRLSAEPEPSTPSVRLDELPVELPHKH